MVGMCANFLLGSLIRNDVSGRMWEQFFLAAGITSKSAERYSTIFKQNKLGMAILSDILPVIRYSFLY